jgi:hypothetical protein
MGAVLMTPHFSSRSRKPAATMRIASILVLLAMAPLARGAQLDTCEPQWYDDFRAPSFDDYVWALAEHEGSVYAGGGMFIAGGTPALGLAQWDGDVWSRVDAGQYGVVTAVESIDDGNGPVLYVAGWRGAWRKDVNGVRPIAEHDDDGLIRAFAWFDGKLYAGGDFSLDGIETVACWDGTTWTRPGGEFGALQGQVDDLAVYDDGSGPALYAVGNIIGRIARWDGVEWRTHIGGGLNGRAGCLEVYDDGTGERLYTSGVFTMAGDVPARGVAVWDGVEWSALGGGLPVDSFAVHRLAWLDEGAGPMLYASQSGDVYRWDGATWTMIAETDESIFDLLAVGSGTNAKLYVGGSFDEIGGVTALKIATFDGTSFAHVRSDDPGNSPDREITDFAIYKPKGARRADVYAAAAFTSVGGVPTCGVARFDGRRWSPVGDVEGGCDEDGSARALAVFDEGDGDMLFVGGDFDRIDGAPFGSIARWDGATWTEVGGGLAGGSYVTVRDLITYDDGTGPCLVVAGRFETAGGVVVNNIARWDGEQWSAFGDGRRPGFANPYALAVFDAGDGPMLYVGGASASFPASLDANVLRWSGSDWEDVSTDQSATVNALITYDDGTGPLLYAGSAGTYGLYLGLVRYDGSSWTTVIPSPFRVNAFAQLEIDGAPRLVVGRYYSSVEGVPINGGVALWDDHAMSPLDGSTAGLVTSLFADPVRGALWVGGSFVEVGNDDVVSSKVARWGCPICLADLSDDQAVSWIDLLYLLESWGASDGAREDLDDDGVVGFGDLMQLLTAWGPC